MAKIGGILKKLLGPQSMARQFFVWNVLGRTLDSAAAPFFQELTNAVNSVFPVQPITPADLVNLVIRERIALDRAIDEAKKSGVPPEDFQLLVQGGVDPPALGDMLRLLRQGKVSQDDVARAVRQSRIASEWIPTVFKLGVEPPSPTDILDALVKGQISESEAHDLYQRLGGDPDYFQLMFTTLGEAPSPIEAAEMATRGVIAWDGSGPDAVSYQQAFLEGRWKNKWMSAYREYAKYFPTPVEITSMLREGIVSHDQAVDLFHKRGVPDNLVGFFIARATTQKVSKVKELTESTIATLYQDQAISDTQAVDMLRALKYTDAEAQFIITTWLLARQLKARNTAITTIHTQFINHKISGPQASALLDRFGVPANQRDELVRLWQEEQKAKVVILTATQVRQAVNKGVISGDDGLARLTQMGYSPDDAAIYLAI